jgi:hypothetical protein
MQIDPDQIRERIVYSSSPIKAQWMESSGDTGMGGHGADAPVSRGRKPAVQILPLGGAVFRSDGGVTMTNRRHASSRITMSLDGEHKTKQQNDYSVFTI